jgi:parallel beta-helix repeat protein
LFVSTTGTFNSLPALTTIQAAVNAARPGDGIDVSGSNGLTINDVTVNPSKGTCLFLFQSNGDKLTGDLAINNGNQRIAVIQSDSNTFNFVSSEFNRTDGIDVGDDAANLFLNGNVDHNGLAGQGRGFLLSTVPNVIIQKVNVFDNKTDGIEAALDSKNIEILDSTVENSNGEGIGLAATSHSVILGNLVLRNGENIGLLKSTGNLIRGNPADNAAGDGIHLDATSTGNTAQGNTALGNGKSDAEDDSVGTGTAGTANILVLNHELKDSHAGALGH